MHITYKARQFYRRLFRVLLVLVMAALILLLCWVLWLRRFIIYTADGVRLDFSLSQQWPLGHTGQASAPITHPDIYFSDPTTTVPPTTEAVDPDRFEAYHVSLDELQNELDAVLERIQQLPAGTPVMLDVKGFWGYFYYSSSLGASSSSFDMGVMDAFFAAVNDSGAYAIARLPAFRDYAFALAHTECGLKVAGGYLWVDSDRSYWLDPGSDGTLEHLIAITRELRALGFDEVAFTHFAFPDTDQVVYKHDKVETITKAAKALANACADSDFAVSFITADHTFPLPEGNCRLYLQDVAAVDVQILLQQMAADVARRTVFFTNSNDTRYQQCGVIKPLKMAQQ